MAIEEARTIKDAAASQHQPDTPGLKSKKGMIKDKMIKDNPTMTLFIPSMTGLITIVSWRGNNLSVVI